MTLSFLDLFFRPKNRGPDQRLPVITRATSERDDTALRGIAPRIRALSPGAARRATRAAEWLPHEAYARRGPSSGNGSSNPLRSASHIWTPPYGPRRRARVIG